MKTRISKAIGFALIAATMGTVGGWADGARAEDPPAEAVARLEARYAGMLRTLRAEIEAALPEVDEQKRAAYLQAREAEAAAKERLNEANHELGAIGRAHGLVGHARNHWIRQADRNIAAARAQLEQATTAEDRTAAQEALAAAQKNREDGVSALEERTRAYEEVRAREPQLRSAVEAAQEAHTEAQNATMQALADLGLADLLASDELDGRLAKTVVLFEAQPRRLATFSARSAENEALVEQLLADEDLMLQMLVADGADDGRYGEAMKIYRAIQDASDRASEGVLQRLALAISLEHAEPIGQRNPVAATDAPATVDPVDRYLHYEKAFLDGELDPSFRERTAWELRFVVDGNEPTETLAWGREMLRNYRPDHIATDDQRWRYVALVRTDIRYGSQDVRHDRDDLQFFQNILMNGGVCGRRAFIGRFVLRAFGIPTTARPQRGHGALVRWTPDGWVPVLGAGWGSGWTRTRYDRDRDFLANTQARENPARFMEVKRAQWIGDVFEERRVFGVHGRHRPGFWYGVSLYVQRAIIDAGDTEALAAVGEELSEADTSDVRYAIEATPVTEDDLRITVGRDGTITIPAVATSRPTRSGGRILFMNSQLGGMQMHYSRSGNAQDFEYTFEAPAAGTYALTAKLVTPSWQQHLRVSANGADPVNIALPHTVGLWDTTEPVEIELAAGRNVLRFSHTSDGYPKGFSIKEFTLTPAR